MNREISSNVVKVMPGSWRPGSDSLLDLLRLANCAPASSILSIRKVESNGGVHLAFKKPGVPPIVSPSFAAYREQLFTWAIEQLLQNTIREVKSVLPDAPLNHVPAHLEKMLRARLDNPDPHFSPQAVCDMLADLGERISEASALVLGHSKLLRDAPRTAMDCLIDWVAALSKAHTSFARIAMGKGKSLWEQGLVSKSRLRRLLEEALADSDSHGHPALRRKAQSLLEQGALLTMQKDAGEMLPSRRDAQDDGGCPLSAENVPYTQLHDNLYGRIFDSTIAAYLVQYPAPAVLQVTYDIAVYLSTCLSKMSPSEASDVVQDVYEGLCDDPRFWTPFKNEVEQLLAVTSPSERVHKLITLLRTPLRDGVDILVRQCLGVRLLVAMRDVSIKSVPWMVGADKNYFSVVLPQRKRLDNINVFTGITQPTAGITFSHQPATLAQDWMKPSSRPADSYKPDFNKPSTPITVALETGMPYVSGISGSTNLMLHLGSYLNRQCDAQIDLRQLLMSVLMFVVFDGGHSIHEVLWVGHHLDGSLQLCMGFEKGTDPLSFVGSTAQLERLFAGTAMAQDLAKAKAMAWNRTLQVFDLYSFYATS